MASGQREAKMHHLTLLVNGQPHIVRLAHESYPAACRDAADYLINLDDDATEAEDSSDLLIDLLEAAATLADAPDERWGNLPHVALKLELADHRTSILIEDEEALR